MGRINKSSSGLLYGDKFDTGLNLMWDMVPNESYRVSFGADSIKLIPTGSRTELLLPVTDDSFVFQARVNYAPRDSRETAGCVVKSVTDVWLDCELSGDTADRYTYLKVISPGNHSIILRGSKDGKVWEDFGNAEIADFNQIGFYIGADSVNDPFELIDCQLYKSPFVTIVDMPNYDDVKIFDANGTEITSSFIIRKNKSSVVIDTMNMVMPIPSMKIEVYNSGVLMSSNTIEDIYGGDSFTYEFNVTFDIVGFTPVGEKYKLGDIKDGFNLYSLRITNNETDPIIGKTLEVVAYSIFDNGDKNVLIAKGTPTTPNLLFDKKIENININPVETVEFTINVIKDRGLISLDDEYKFKIIMS